MKKRALPFFFIVLCFSFAVFLALTNIACEKESAISPQIVEGVGEGGGAIGGGAGSETPEPQIDISKLPKLELPETVPGEIEQYKPQPRVVVDFNAIPELGKDFAGKLEEMKGKPGMVVVNTGPVQVYKKDPNDQWEMILGKYVSGKMIDGSTPLNILTIDKLVLSKKSERNLKLRVAGDPPTHIYEIRIGGYVVSQGFKMKPVNIPGEKGYDLELLAPDAGVYGEAKDLEVYIGDSVTGGLNVVHFKSIVYEGACEYYGGITLDGYGKSPDPHRIDKGYEFWVTVKDGGWGKLKWTIEDEVGWYHPGQTETEWLKVRNCGSLKNVALTTAAYKTYYDGRVFWVKTANDYPDCIYNASMSRLKDIFDTGSGEGGGSELERITITVKDECGYEGSKQFIYMLDYYDPYDQEIMDVVSCSQKRYKPTDLCDGNLNP